MPVSDLQIVISARDAASQTLRTVSGELNGLGGASTAAGRATASASDRLVAFGAVAAGAGVAVHQLAGLLQQSVDAANRNQAALIGLSSVTRAFNGNTTAAEAAARNLAKDGLMSVTDAATGLKNLLASGFSLDQAIILMNRFKDSAAFNRQAALGFGEAISSATEGIKNGNSILVDNAGVTKNLSVILQEAGYSAQDVGKASTDAGIRMALFNGILKETKPQLGDAARLADTFAGKQAMASAQTEVLRQQIGTAIQAALLPLLTAVTPLIVQTSAWVQQHQRLVAAIAIGLAAFLALIAVLGALGAAAMAVAALVSAFGVAVVAAGVAAAAAIAAAVAYIVLDFNNLKGYLQNFRGVVVAIFASLAEPIIAPFRTAYNAIMPILNGIRSKVPNLGAGLRIPGFASGVNHFSGGLALVGEQGPELVSLPRGASVLPARQTAAAMGGGVTIHFNGPVSMANEQEAQQVGLILARQLQSARAGAF